jgi:hypothetical protein
MRLYVGVSRSKDGRSFNADINEIDRKRLPGHLNFFD